MFAIEPQAGIFRLLAANTLLNGALNTRLSHGASGSRSGILELADLNYGRPQNCGALSFDNLTVSDPKTPSSARCR
jgi:hypothetical protein